MRAQTSVDALCDSLMGVCDNLPTLKQTAELMWYHINGRGAIQAEPENYDKRQIWQAPLDALYYGIGDERNVYEPYGISEAEFEEAKAQDADVKGKHTGSYVWALENVGGKLYWGMNHNFLCHALGTGMGNGKSSASQLASAYETSCWVCEGENDARVKESGDILEADLIWPRSYSYDPGTGYVTDISPERDELAQYTQGFRACGGLDGVVFLCGPDEKYGSTIYAFDVETDELIAKSHFEGAIKNDPDMVVTNMRKFVVLDDVLYLGIAWQKADGTNGGAILRWYGDKDDPMNFQVVALCEQAAAEIALHKGHIFIGGWDTGSGTDRSGGIYRSKSPYNAETGLTPENPMEFDCMWHFSSYEKNPACIRTSFVGEIRSYKGKLYWGMLSAMYTAPLIGPIAYQAENDLEVVNGILGSIRPTTFWRADFDSEDDKDVELLYGDTEVPVFDYVNHKWDFASTGHTPTFGRSGFGSLFTNYGAWAMREYKGSLYIGCMDISTIVEPMLNSSILEKNFSESALGMTRILFKDIMGLATLKDPKGYNLFRLDDPDEPVKCVTNDGFGNPYAYGIRNFANINDDLVIGTANPQTLSANAGGEVLLFNPEEITTGQIQTSVTPIYEENSTNTIVPASVYMRKEAGYILLSPVDPTKSVEKANLYDMSGSLVATGIRSGSEQYVMTDNLSCGVYVLTATIEGKAFSRKVMLK